MNKKRLVAIDVGNTNVTVGVFCEGRLLKVCKFESVLFESKKTALRTLKKSFFADSSLCAGASVYVCSVTPALNQTLRSVVREFFGTEMILSGEDVTVPIINTYRIPSQVGQDRLVNAYAGVKLFGAGLIIVDFGTAITFDVVSKNREYLGGLIVPGFRLMQESLHKKTALLPYVELARPIEAIGKDTVSSIRAGLIFGVAGLCESVINRLLKKECKGFKVVATGGDVRLVKPFVTCFSKVEENLIMMGLCFLADSHEGSRIKKN